MPKPAITSNFSMLPTSGGSRSQTLSSSSSSSKTTDYKTLQKINETYTPPTFDSSSQPRLTSDFLELQNLDSNYEQYTIPAITKSNSPNKDSPPPYLEGPYIVRESPSGSQQIKTKWWGKWSDGYVAYFSVLLFNVGFTIYEPSNKPMFTNGSNVEKTYYKVSFYAIVFFLPFSHDDRRLVHSL